MMNAATVEGAAVDPMSLSSLKKKLKYVGHKDLHKKLARESFFFYIHRLAAKGNKF